MRDDLHRGDGLTEPFRTVLLDCPWPENGGGKCQRGANKHYKTLKVRDIPRVIILGCKPFLEIADDSHCYMWATNNYLEAALWTMGQIGFRYVTNVTWAKPRFGLGQYFRGQTEHLLFGVRGNGFVVKKGLAGYEATTLLHAPLGVHSEKPEASYALIERRSFGPYLELFARRERPGWTVWGEEVSADH